MASSLRCKNAPSVYLGGEKTLTDVSLPVVSDGAEFIVAEALRDDTDLPLYVACGGSLNTIASALLEAKLKLHAK